MRKARVEERQAVLPNPLEALQLNLVERLVLFCP